MVQIYMWAHFSCDPTRVQCSLSRQQSVYSEPTSAGEEPVKNIKFAVLALALSPFWGAGHDDWVHGRPTPFLPGDAAHTLTLRPANAQPK